MSTALPRALARALSFFLLSAPGLALQQLGGSAGAGTHQPAARTPAPRCRPQALTLPTWSSALSISQPPCGAAVWPFSARHSPRGDRLYVPLFGGYFGSGGCRVLRLDPATLNVVGQIPTDEGPQEVAFVTHPDGSLKLGFVSNSAASTVTVFDASDAVVATVPIPFAAGGFFPTAFPFGLAVSPDQSTLYVGTQDGSGSVFALDTTTLALDPARSISLGVDHAPARLAFAGSRLVLPTTYYHPGYTGATAKLVVVDPAQPQVLNELVLASSSSGVLFPSAQDCAVDCDGTVWVAGFDLGPWVFGVDPVALTLEHVLPTHTAQPEGKFQALGLSRDGLLVVGDFATHELAVLDARRRVWLATLDTLSLPALQRAPQEIEFSPTGDALIVPWAASDNLGVYQL